VGEPATCEGTALGASDGPVVGAKLGLCVRAGSWKMDGGGGGVGGATGTSCVLMTTGGSTTALFSCGSPEPASNVGLSRFFISLTAAVTDWPCSLSSVDVTVNVTLTAF